MTADILNKVETIVNVLLQVSDSVIEVSREHVFTRVWNAEANAVLDVKLSDYAGKKIEDIGNDNIIKECATSIDAAFEFRKRDYIEYTNDAQITYGVSIITIHPDPDFVFIAVKNLTRKNGIVLAEDKWKLTLDATGDGMWDANMVTGKIYFSEKWHEIFGYDASEITRDNDWTAKLHPDDVLVARARMEAYFEGRQPSYSAEIRFLCKDGSYKWVLSRGVLVSRTSDGRPLRFIGTHTDIDARKRADEQHYESSQLLSKLLDSLKDGILVTNEHSDVIFANQAFCRIYEIDGAPEAIIGSNAREGLKSRKEFFVNSEEFLTKTLVMLDSSDMIIDEEWEMKNGKILIRDYIPVLLSNNRRIGIWKLRDITELKNTDKRFELQRKFYEQILNNLGAHVVVFDANRRYLYLNPVAVKDPEMRKWMMGKTDEEYFAYRNRPMSIADRRRHTFEMVRESGQTVAWEERMETPKGEIEYHLRTMTPVYKENGELYIMIGYGQDITDRVKAQEALKTSQETFASAFDYSGIGIALVSPFGKWLDVNRAICDITGYSKEELLTQRFHDITYVEDMELDRELINKMLRQEITTYTIEKRYVSKQQKIILVSLTVSLVWSSDDSPKFFIAQVVDITKKKELENEISRKNTELEATRVSLINKINQLEELSHIIAHNLRGPAANIKMLSEALVAKNEGGEAAENNPLSSAFTTNEALGFIKDSSESLMSSLQTLMEIAEIKLNKDVPYDDCNVTAIIDEIMAQLHGIIYEKRAVITSDLKVTYIKYPRAYLESILYNFISNALKYSHADVPPEIKITTRMQDKHVQIIVRDNGIGIDMERYGDRVFKLNEIFHQGYDSKGVGLYITKTQVESFGGSIEVHSAPNMGSEFIVTL